MLQRAWDKQWLTNGGELVLELRDRLQEFLDVPHLILTANGTLPLQIAIKALGLKGEIITTPFSYVATTNAIIWEGCTPVFVDIHPEYLTIDETKIEAAITPRTSAILATHVFGNPCNVKAIATIANKHGLKVIYDGAHAFGVSYEDTPIMRFGDVSTCSFHATKLFQTGEGGAISCTDIDLHERLLYLHNFGHTGTYEFAAPGINAKMSELHAAMGLAVYPYIQHTKSLQKHIVQHYLNHLSTTAMRFLRTREGTRWNYDYMPVIFEEESTLLNVEKALNREDIFPRRYFYPALNRLPYVAAQTMPIAEYTASRILCLPLYPGLEENDVDRVVKAILQSL